MKNNNGVPANEDDSVREFDVVICGGGLAGLTLARQLKQQLPQISVVLIDKLSRPLPEAAFKVGESTVETGAYYLAEILNLTDYFEKHHLHKMGLRYFFSTTTGRFKDRPEFGLSSFPAVNTYQIDRGMLENDLRSFNEKAGVVMLEGCSIQDAAFATDNGRHTVTYKTGNDGLPRIVRARWVIDATGRRRLLQKKLNLSKPAGKACSASWFRYEGRIDVSNFVSRTEENWHKRVPNDNRYYSTTHLMGDGYWVWLIPLSSNATSVGIVALEDIHPFTGFNTYERACQWLRQHEPELADYLDGCSPLDFRVMRRYSYSSRKVFSIDRWACVGEAGFFSDPFYSPGTDFIGFGNSIITQLVGLDLEGKLTPKTIEEYDQFILFLNNLLTVNFQIGYHFYGNAVVMTAKLLWDICAAWSFVTPQMFNSLFLDKEKSAPVRRANANFIFLTQRMQQLFVDWAAKSTGRLTYDFIDYLKIPFIYDLRLRNLRSGKSVEELVQDAMANIKTLEELAQVLFLLAVEDVMPAYMNQFAPPVWLNAWSVSLNPERWQAERLFAPDSEPRDLSHIREQVRSLFHMAEVAKAPTFNHDSNSLIGA
jgi:flavin-dependent dehydrogenase